MTNLIVLLFFVFKALGSNEPIVKSEITSVVVYQGNALITRSAVVSVNRGENQIKIGVFTPNLINQSVQLEILKGDGVRVGDVKVVETYLKKPEAQRESELKAKIDSLNNLISLKQGELEVVLGKIEFLKKLTPNLQAQKITMSEIESYFKFYGRALNENVKDKLKVEQEIDKLKAEKKKYEDELNKVLSVKEKGKIVEVSLISDLNKEIEIGISYLVSGVNWFPGYEVRANSKTRKVEFNFFAFVKQLTGEDWMEVPAEISTAQVQIWGTPPEISPWFVDIYKPTPVPFMKQRVPMIQKEENIAGAQEIEPEFITPEVETGITSVNFKLQKISIPSDDQQHKIFLASFLQASPFAYYAVPKLSRYAYLKTSLKNDFSFPILPGEARIFVDGKYVSSSSIKRILSGETFDLSLGVDESVKLNRNLKKKFTEYTGVLGRSKKISYEYEIEIENGKTSDIDIEVKDNFPVSRNEKIKVMLESPTDREAEISSDGIIKWKIKLKPQEKKSLNVKFYVEHPMDIEVIGLE